MVPGLERLRDDGAAAVAAVRAGPRVPTSPRYRVIERRPLEAALRRHARRHVPATLARRSASSRDGLAELDGWTARRRATPLAVALVGGAAARLRRLGTASGR